jgi:hypothetical protein
MATKLMVVELPFLLQPVFTLKNSEYFILKEVLTFIIRIRTMVKLHCTWQHFVVGIN